MKVSIALHRSEPSLALKKTHESDHSRESNQKFSECAYMNYNRQYAEINDDGYCIIDAEFPIMGETFPDWVAQFFSIGICEDIPSDTGGAIINYASLYEPIPVLTGLIPKIKAVMRIEPQRLKEIGY